MTHLFVSIQNSGAPDFERETVRYDDFVRRLIKPDTEAMMASHIAIGLTGEAGEFADNVKREYHYGKKRTVDSLENVYEELGDIMWYLTAALNHYNISLQQVVQMNADKLSKRYVELKYSDSAAIGRADKGP